MQENYKTKYHPMKETVNGAAYPLPNARYFTRNLSKSRESATGL